jgi:hypothetical protein
MMTRHDLETIWVPRIGEKATRELAHLRRTGFVVTAMPVVAGVGGVLIGTSALGDVLGITLLVVGAWYVAAFIRAQAQLAAAMSEWFGIKITGGGTPRMNPNRFDAWCQERGLHPAPKLGPNERMLWSRHGSVASSREWFSGRLRVAGTLCLTSERVMFVPVKLGSIVIAMPRIQQVPVGEVESVAVSEPKSTSATADVEPAVSFVLRGGGQLTVTVDQADQALGELHALLLAT